MQINLRQAKQMALDAKYSLWEQARNLGRDVKLYWHWSAGRYEQDFSDYHFCIHGDGSIHAMVNDLSKILSHTWRRNTGSIGIALDCAYNATTYDLGAYAPTEAQIESLARLSCVLGDALDLSIDLPRMMTHGEAADNLDGWYAHEPYGPDSTCERWDLAILSTGDEWKSGGDIIRGKVAWYRDQYATGVENHF